MDRPPPPPAPPSAPPSKTVKVSVKPAKSGKKTKLAAPPKRIKGQPLPENAAPKAGSSSFGLQQMQAIRPGAAGKPRKKQKPQASSLMTPVPSLTSPVKAIADIDSLSIVLRAESTLFGKSLETRTQFAAGLECGAEWPNRQLYALNDARRELEASLRVFSKLSGTCLTLDAAGEVKQIMRTLRDFRTADGIAGAWSQTACQFNLWLTTGEILAALDNNKLLEGVSMIMAGIDVYFPSHPVEDHPRPSDQIRDCRIFRAWSFGLLKSAVEYAYAHPGERAHPSSISHAMYGHPAITLAGRTGPELIELLHIWTAMVEKTVDRMRELVGLGQWDA